VTAVRGIRSAKWRLAYQPGIGGDAVAHEDNREDARGICAARVGKNGELFGLVP
jgi:hypothetical protein